MLGYLRETKEAALKAGIDKNTGMCRSGLEEYLSIIFPGVEWIHDKPLGKINGITYRIRPDYRSDELKIIVEFDGIQHYQSPKQIVRDQTNTETYQSLGYTVVRIPYFIQLTKHTVKELFNIDVNQELFPENVPSLGNNEGDPTYLCHAGIIRMAKEFKRFPDQYICNLQSLKRYDDYFSGYTLLENSYKQIT